MFRVAVVTPALIHKAGMVWKQCDRPTWASQLLRLAARKATTSVPPLLELADLEERRHRVPAAQRAVGKALQRDPRSQDARCLAAHIARRNGDREGAMRMLRELLKEPVESQEAHWKGWHYLGQLLDGQGAYPEAMEAFRNGKKILGKGAKPITRSYAAEHAVLQELNAGLNRDQLNRWRREGEADETDYPGLGTCLLCGPPRSGTTLAAAILGAHPGVLAVDECVAFGPEVSDPLLRLRKQRGNPNLLALLDRLSPAQRAGLANGYLHRMERWVEEPLGRRTLLDKNPALTPSLPMAARVLPRMRFLVMKRDLRDVAISCYMQALPLNNISVNFLSLESTARYLAFVRNTWERFRDRADSAQWLEVDYERLTHDLEGETRRMVAFLGLPWKRRALRFHRRAARQPMRSPTYVDVTRKVHTRAIGRWEHYASYLEPHLGLLAP
jgi:tetratricopeptide (TPR) repeat protein